MFLLESISKIYSLRFMKHHETQFIEAFPKAWNRRVFSRLVHATFDTIALTSSSLIIFPGKKRWNPSLKRSEDVSIKTPTKNASKDPTGQSLSDEETDYSGRLARGFALKLVGKMIIFLFKVICLGDFLIFQY